MHPNRVKKSSLSPCSNHDKILDGPLAKQGCFAPGDLENYVCQATGGLQEQIVCFVCKFLIPEIPAATAAACMGVQFFGFQYPFTQNFREYNWTLLTTVAWQVGERCPLRKKAPALS